MTDYRVYDRHGHWVTTCRSRALAEVLAATVGGWWEPVVRKPTLAELHRDLKVAA